MCHLRLQPSHYLDHPHLRLAAVPNIGPEPQKWSALRRRALLTLVDVPEWNIGMEVLSSRSEVMPWQDVTVNISVSTEDDDVEHVFRSIAGQKLCVCVCLRALTRVA